QMPSLLRNELPTVPYLDHGWFGVRNRVPKETEVTDAERDENEAKEFSKPAWESVPTHRKGIKALMDYVDRERRTQLHRQIPQIITEIRAKHRSCEEHLKRLGEPRNTPQARRYYVLQFCNEMQKMTEA
ncbi:dynamin family GTPase, partial [Aspergillus sclerotialis]